MTMASDGASARGVGEQQRHSSDTAEDDDSVEQGHALCRGVWEERNQRACS